MAERSPDEGGRLTYGEIAGLAGSTHTYAASVNIMAFNSTSNQVLYDYAGSMDLAALDSLAKAHQADPIPRQDLLGQLPQPLPGWLWAIPGGQYNTNGTFTSATGMYMKGDILFATEAVIVSISHVVGGFTYTSGEEVEPPENVTFDQGYPKEVTVQGYPALEWRATGDNVAGFSSGMPGELKAIGGLWIGLSAGTPISEIPNLPYFLAAFLPFVVLGARTRD